MQKPTDKQHARINELINHFGKDKIVRHLRRYYPYADIDNLTKNQAQKLIVTKQLDLPRFQRGYSVHNPEQYM